MPDDGTLAAEQLSVREIVATALGLLRAYYVFPERAERAAAAVEARLAAGEYDDLDEITLTDRLTSHLYEVCADKHLRVRLGGRPARPGLPAPASPGPGPVPAPAGPGPGAGPGARAGPGPARRRPGPADHEARLLAMRRRGAWTTSAFTESSGSTATSATWTSAGCLSRRLPGRPSPRRWNWSRGRTR